MEQTNSNAAQGKVSYGEMRMVAQEIHRLEAQARRIRTAALVIIGLLVGTAVFAGVIALLVSAFTETQIKQDGGQLAMVKKDSDKVIATTQSTEDLDISDMVDYGRDKTDSNGEADGEWTLTEERIARIRTISWKAGQTMEVHHIAEIVRHDGTNTRVEMTTKAGHKIVVWDNTGGDNFDVMITRFDRSTNQYLPEEEINANGDESNTGRGRVLVSLTRPVLEARPRGINVDDYWDDD